MLKKILLIFNLILALSFTSCEGESSDKREESLSSTLSFLGITDPVIVKKICEDKDKDGRCGAKELLSKISLKNGESIDGTLQTVPLMENGEYFLENITPNVPLLVEIYDPQNIKYDGGSLILRFNGFKIEEKKSIKEISAIQLLEDWEFLSTQETEKFKETENRELLDHVIFESLEKNYNLLRDESLSTQVATDKGLEVLANKLKKVDIAEELPNKIVFCTGNDTCMQNLVVSTFQALTITKKEGEVIAQNVKSAYNSNSITVMPTLTPFPTVIPMSTPVSTTVVPTSTPVSTTVVPTSKPVSTTVVPTSTPVSTTVVPTSTPVSRTVVPMSTPVSTTVVPRLKEIQKVKSTLKKTGQITSYQKFDDGDYQIGVNSNYSRVGDIITDNITGLQWQDDKDAKIVHKTWITAENYKKRNYNDTSGDTAITYCDRLTLGGYANWRIPTRKELLGIINYGKFNPSVDSIFVNVSSKKYWSSTKIADDSGDISSRWVVSFLNGAMINSNGQTNNNSYCIRCIRGEE